jgi:hypothetical protein
MTALLHVPMYPVTVTCYYLLPFKFQVLLSTTTTDMAPSKQALLPLGLFMKNPSKTSKKKHVSLEKKNKPKKFKSRVDKRAAKRLAEEQDKIKEAEKWQHFLEENDDHPAPNAPYNNNSDDNTEDTIFDAEFKKIAEDYIV